MANDTGLLLQNNTGNIITIDLFEQGQTGENVPKSSITATNEYFESESYNGTSNFINWYINNATNDYYFPVEAPYIDNWIDIPNENMFVGGYLTFRLVVLQSGEEITLDNSEPKTLAQLCLDIKSGYENYLKNVHFPALFTDVSDIVNVTANAQAEWRTIGFGYTLYSRVRFNINYLVSTDILNNENVLIDNINIPIP